MKELYRRIGELNLQEEHRIYTVLSGECSGEKALFSKEGLIWESKEHGFFYENQEQLSKNKEMGKIKLNETALFSEVLAAEKQMVICGGGHVSIPIIKMGRMLGFHITVLEDRPHFANLARQAGANSVICQSFQEGLKMVLGNEDTYFVIVTRGHRYDYECLEAIAKKPHAYIGMIGSKRRVKLVKDSIIEAGADPEVIQNIYSPIGLNIGAETPEEIAISILAEIIEVKNKIKRIGDYSKEILQVIQNDFEEKVMVTIVDRKGSAPRKTGTKMLVLGDGRCVGSIGGGCAEANIYQKALFKIRQKDKRSLLCKVDMTGTDAEEEGMVCGGVIEVLLELI